jgi:DNA recombination protein Rad52
MKWDEVTKHLTAPLSPDAVKPPPQGKFGEYVDALHVIREANRIFGHNGWSYEVTRLEQTHSAVIDSQRGPQLRCSFLCSVKVTIDGVVREGTAVGIGSGKESSAGDVIESAVKEAETDALKRALRTFGNTFGLALYEKNRNAREVGYTASQQEIDAAIEKINTCSSIEELTAYAKGLGSNMPHIAKHEQVKEAGKYRRSELEQK